MTSLLEELEFFRECDPKKLADLAVSAKFKTYEASDILVYEEDAINRVYFLDRKSTRLNSSHQ